MIDQNLLEKTANLSDIQNNYVTGGPGPTYANSVLDKYMTPKASSNNGVPTQTNTPLASTPSGTRFPYYYPSAGVAGNEEAYAQGQSWYSKAFNATTKGVGLAATTFLEGTVGMLVGTANAVSDGKFSSFYDNPFSRSLDDFNKAAEDKLPNYYTQQESNAEAWNPKNWFTANFLFDKVVKNMGFAVGAIGAGYANAGILNSLGLFTKIASAGALAETANMTEEAIASVAAGQRAGAIESGMKSVAQKFLNSYNVLNKAQRAITAGLGTMGEASFEAIQSSKEFRQKLLGDYIAKNGLEPEGDDLAQINDMAERAGNTTFGLNVALLSVTNYLQWPKLLGSSYAAERKLFADTAHEIADLAVREGKHVAAYDTMNLAQKALFKAKNVSSLFFSPSEAFEEGAQTAIQHGVSNYYNKAYNDGKGGTPDILSDLFGEGTRYSLTSKEGIESILIGGLSGGIMEAKHKIGERGLTGTGGHQAINTVAAIDAFNKNTFSGYLKNTLDSVNRGTVLQQQRAESIRRGDFQEARDLEYDYGHNYLAPRIKYGRFDMVMDDIDTQRQLSSSDEGMTQLRADGIISDDTTPEQYRARLANIESHAKSMALMYQSLNTRYGALRDKEGNRTHPDEVIDKMVYAASKVADYDKRIASISSIIASSGVDTTGLMNNITENGTIKQEEAKGLLDQIDNMDVISETKDILKEQVRDLAEIGLRRKTFIREYDRIKKNPSSFKDQELIPTDAESVPVPQIAEDGRYRNRAFALGQTYATTDPFLREGNNIVVRPTATLHERNALGEVRATVPTGETTFIQPKDLRGYTFRDKSPYDENLTNKIFQASLDSVLSRRGVDKPEGTLQEQLNTLNTPENTDLMDAVEAAFQRDLADLNKAQEEIDKLEADKAKLKKLEDTFNKMSAEAGTVPTGDPVADEKTIRDSIAEEGNKKTADKLFISTTSPDTSKGDTENGNFHRRSNKFLNNLPKIDNPHELKVILVTRTNQDSLGLGNLIPETVDGVAATDINTGVIRAVFIRSNTKGNFFINEDGDIIAPVGEQVELNSLVYSTMPNTSINWRDGQPRYISTGPKAITEEQATTIASNWKNERAKILAQQDYKLYDFTVSRGIPNVSDRAERNSVTSNLVTQRDLDSPLITIPTQSIGPDSKVSNVTVGDNVYPYPIGRPILIKGGTVAYLNNRKLTDHEKVVVKKAIIELAKNIDNKPVIDYLKGVLFWGKPKGTPSTNQIWYEAGKLYMGAVDNYIPFTAASIISSPELDKFLNGAFLNTNNHLLKLNEVYDEITDIADDGSLTQVQWRSYQHYLLSSTYVTSEFDNSGLSGTARTDIPLTTNIATLDSKDPYAVPFEQKYATLSGMDTVGVQPIKQQKQISAAPLQGEEDTTDEEITPIIQAGSFILDGTTLNPINRNGKVPVEVAATFGPDGVTFTNIKWNIPDDVPQEARDALMVIVTADISKAVVDEIANRNSNITPTPETRPATVVAPPSTPSDPKVEVPEQEETEPEPITKAGKFTLDGKAMNPITYNGKNPLSVAAVIEDDGYINITDVKWNIPDSVPQEARDALIQMALSQIGEAIIGEVADRNKATEPTTETPPVSNKPSDSILKNLRPPTTQGDFRIAISMKPYIIEDIPAFTAYMKEVLPQIPVHNVQNMIEMTGNGYAFGVFRDNAIYLYDKAEIGTGYHEAFESVYNAFLTNREQTALHAEFKRRPGTFTDRETGKKLAYSKATAHQAKEQMAEEFRDFKLNGTMFTPKETSFFRKLIGMIREFISGNTIAKVFKKLDTGYYSDKPVLQRRIDPQYRPEGLNTAYFREVMEGMTVRMFQELFKDNKNIVAFDEQNPKYEEIYQKVYDNFETLYENDIKYELNRILTEMNASADVQEAEWGEYWKFHKEVWGTIKGNWQSITKEHKDFLKPFSVIFTQDENANEVTSNEDDTNNDEKNQNDYVNDILKIDAKKSASTAVKLLFATIADVERLQTPINPDETLNTPDEKVGATKLPKIVRYASVFNKFLHEVSNTNGLTNIMQKLKALAVKDQRFIRLYNRLRGKNNYQNLSMDDWKLLMKTYSTASKQKPDYMIQVTDDVGNTYITNSNDNVQTKVLIRKWLNNMKGYARKGNLLYIDDGVYKINVDEVRKYQVGKVAADRFRFVSDIGFTFTQEMYNNLPSYDRQAFNDAAVSIHAQLLKSGEIGTMTNQALGISGGMNKLAELAVRTTGDDSNSQHFNIEGEPVQNFILTNYVSTILNDINAYPTRDSLIEALPHYNDTFAQDSQLLKLDGILFDKDGNRKESPLKVVIVEGSTKAVSNTSKGTATANLSIADRRMQEFNQNLNGVYYILMPADSKTEWSMKLGHYINFSDFNNKGALANKINSIFRSYLKTELTVAQDAANRKHITNLEKGAHRLRFFKDILHVDLVTSANDAIDTNADIDTWMANNKDAVSDSVNEWIKNRVDAQIENFKEYRILSLQPQSAEVGQNIYHWRGLDSEFSSRAETGAILTDADVRDLVRFRTLNYVINNIEMHKVLFGDPAMYKDATKRIKSFLSGREVTYNTDPEFNLFANDELNKAGDIDLMPGDPGYYRFKDYMNTVTTSDIKLVGSIAMNDSLTADQIDPASKDAIYGDTNEADAQSWATLGAYREMLLKAGGRWTDEQEAQYQYDAAYERLARSKRDDKYQYTYKNEALRSHDEELTALPSPEADLYVLKPIGTGVKYESTIADMFLDKTSTIPMSYRLAEGRAMEDIYLQMVTQDKQYLIAISGRKVGAEGTHNMYNPDGSINQESFNNNVKVPFKYWGIQVETGGHKDKQTRGSQLTKLAVIDLLSAGVPVDITDSLDQWLGKTEEERLASSKVYSLTQKNKSLLEAMTNRGYSDILNKLGITENDEGEFKIDNYQKVVDYIRKEIDRRELPDNVRDAVSVNPVTGEFNIPLEALNNYKILKNIIYSIVDKNILSPKVSGGPKVQVSSTLFEKNKRQAVYRDGDSWKTVTDYNSLSDEQKKTVRLTSSDLKFYTPEEPWIEILVPHWFKDKIIESYKKQGKTGAIPDDEQILAHLKNSPLLKAIGFRIPTQALSSVENIRIKGFLPQSYGGAVVVPSEITSKAGSDFDIDKLNIYLRNFRIDSNGMPQHIDITDRDLDPSTEEGQRGLYNKFFGRSSDIINMLSDAESANSMMNSIFGTTDNDIADMLELSPQEVTKFNALLEKHIPFEKFKEVIQGKSFFDIYAMFDPKAVENEYYENLNDLLSLPQNFKRLIQPNSAKELEDLRNELLEAQGLEKSDVKGNYSVLLDPMFMSQVRHNFISGKGGVGIAAVQQTNNPLSQAAVLVVNHRNFKDKLNSIEKSMVPDVKVLLPHNTVTIKGESYVTLSKTLNTLGEYISDKISSYINGYVDVAKDAFIIELGADLNVASTYMFLEKIGVPTKDVIFFMNQPIIRELLKTMQINGLKNPNTWTVQKKITDEVRAMFPTKGPRSGALMTGTFKSNIENYRDQKKGLYKFSESENAEQQQILDEFFKYYVMASHLFKVTQGSNYDTANFNEPALVYRKQRATENARYRSIISSVDAILNTSFIGNTADKLIKTKGALGTIFKLDDPAVSPIIESVLDPYLDPDKFLSETDYLGIANKVQSSFIDWITQTLGEGKIGSRLKSLLIDMDTSVANQLFKLKKELPQDSDILSNPIFQQLQATYDNSYSSEVKIVTLIEKANDAPSSNMYTDAFRELRDNPHTSELYHGLIYAGILQSGIRKSPISFTDLIPVEDYSPILSTVMQNLGHTPNLNTFSNLHIFQRNNWADDQIVPEAKLKRTYNNPQDPNDYILEAYFVFPELNTVKDANGYSFIKLHSLKDSRLLGYPVIKVGHVRIDPETEQEYTKERIAKMKKIGDYTFQTYMLYTPIMQRMGDGTNTALSRADDRIPGASYIYYKQINAWGTPGKVQEYYSTPEPSILPSNDKIKELSDTDIMNAVANPTSTKEVLNQQANEQKYKDDYLPFEDITDNGSTEDTPILSPAALPSPSARTIAENKVREDAASAPFDLTEEEIQQAIQRKLDSGDATTTNC